MRGRRAAAAFGLLVAVSAGPAAVAQTSSPKAAVKIVDFAFEQKTLTVELGTTVTWTNGDAVPHDVVDRGGTFDTQPILPGNAASVTLTVPGTYSYFCRIHPTLMNATIVVRGEGSQAPVNRIQVHEFAFEPSRLTVATGSLVLLANVGALPHTMTARDGSFDSGIVTPGPSGGKFAGSNVAFSVSQPGTYPFFCRVHPELMHGVLVVTGPPRAGPLVSSSAPREVKLGVKDFAFDPIQASVAPGGTLTWTNAGPSPHTATFDSVDLDTGTIEPGRAAGLKAPTVPGSYAYHCNIHPTLMRGVVVVVGANELDPTRTAAGQAALAASVNGGGGALSWLALAAGVLAAFVGGLGVSAFARNRWGAE